MECNLNESGVVTIKVEQNPVDTIDNNYFEESADLRQNTSRDFMVELRTEEVQLIDIKDEVIDSMVSGDNPDIKLFEIFQNNQHHEPYDSAPALIAMEVKKEKDEEENSSNFRVDRNLIESISKENQDSELRNLEGLSVYDQEILEAGILRQVDQALDEAVGEPPCPQPESNDVETDMERQIRLGEMTPFGSTMNTAATAPWRKTDGLKEVENYLRKQLELQKKGRNKKLLGQKIGVTDKRNKTIDKKGKPVRVQKKVETHVGKKRQNDHDLSDEDSETLDEKLGHFAAEPSAMWPTDGSGSEYVPSDPDLATSDDEVRLSKTKEKSSFGTKRKLKKEKPYKIPEDWKSDDSDWEYSDEEGNFKKNKRSKKELDDGDVDSYNRRIQQWERKIHQSGEGKAEEQFHEISDGYKLPKYIWDKLYNYQRVGVRWLRELDQQRCGGILGDEMGLGKTIQVIAFLAGLHVSDLRDQDTRCRGLGPTLIVCPTTVMHQWVREFHQWYPPVRVGILHESGTFCGKQRSRLISNMVQASGVLITSYTGATMHKDDIITRRWHYVILDEGHKIRNPDAQITLVVKQLRTAHRLILSGSPMQNNLKELWSLFDFVFPGKLGTLPVFLEHFSVPITQGGYANASQVQVTTAFKCATVLKDTIAPYLLRRMKADVKSHVSLPDKNEQVLFCRLTDEQRALYRGYVSSGDVERILEGRLKIFVGLINLRKICNHPDLYPGGKSRSEEGYGHWSKAGKMIVVETLLKLWHKQCHRVLIFTQSRQMLLIMEAFVQEAGYSYLKLDGNVSIAARQPLINKFNQDTSYFVMLLTTRVGGLGVNLTGANRVLIYDPDWNPATDTQARERAWRIGQQRAVTVYRLITAGTIEEKMYHRQIFKQFLCNKVLKDPRQRRFFKSNDLFELFALKETDVEGSTETAAIFAGTNSEVRLDPTKKYKHRRIEPKLSAERPLETYARKKAEKAKKIQDQKSEITIEKNSQVQFSVDKIERMKKLAHLLSQKCVEVVSPEKTSMGKSEEVAPTVTVESSTAETYITPSQDIGELKIPHQNNDKGKTEAVVNNNNTEERKQHNLSTQSTNNSNNLSSTPSTSSSNKVKGVYYKQMKKHKKKKKKCYKDAKFEGEKVPHLVKAGTSRDVNEDIEDSNYATQDEYVLQKLFAKSGLQTAMKHDTIMEGGPADYALVEGEADRVAKQALDKLQESGRECWRAESGVPTFTGTNGARNFQPSRKGLQVGKTTLGSISSSELLQRIRQRNGTVDAADRELELARDMRSYIVSYGGTVNTDRLINRFEGRLEEGSSPLFKSLLSKMCTFYRAPDRLGYWTIKEEFNW